MSIQIRPLRILTTQSNVILPLAWIGTSSLILYNTNNVVYHIKSIISISIDVSYMNKFQFGPSDFNYFTVEFFIIIRN